MKFQVIRKKRFGPLVVNDGNADIAIMTSPRRLTAYYATALLMIGSITLMSHVIQERTLESGEGMAAVINMSGRQRMLSQRIHSLAAQYGSGDVSAREELVKAADEFEAAHDHLSSDYISDQSNDNWDKTLHQIYFVGQNSLDKEVRVYIRDARKVSLLARGDPGIAPLLVELAAEARSPLLSSLNEVVRIHQKEAEEGLRRLRRLQWVLMGIMGATLSLEGVLIFRPLVFRIVSLSKYLLRQATCDPLTGVSNRRGFTDRAAAEFGRFQRYKRPLTVITVDIDHFKKINDGFGHDAGDAVLKAFGEILQRALRPTDTVGRLGGEEFAILLPETSLHGATALAERLRQTIADMKFIEKANTLSVTASFGVASVSLDSLGVDAALSLADKLLYIAKQSGRNCVVSENSSIHTSTIERDRREEQAANLLKALSGIAMTSAPPLEQNLQN